MSHRPVALVTGASRSVGIGAAIALALAQSGWDVAITFWRPYDSSMPWGSDPEEVQSLCASLESRGARATAIEADLSQTGSAEYIFDAVERDLGPVTSLVMAHCYSVDSDILTTSVESFDRHFAINARATWLLVRELGRRFRGEHGTGRIIALTSDHTAGNLPYGASKGALDRIVLAAASEFRALGVTANVINPGATDTGWMSQELMADVRRWTLLGRIGMPQDCANLVRFLCSPEGGWINGQLLYSNGGIQ
ncbi:MAG: SDR family oxidoreductase [Anaerolineae bacterium]|nr:SDR family oxidoreductase [Anaerolineae bacterium]MCB9132687.1 SDR family oxidoreductase [Anaerolineales bacterium]MCB0229250.1 SDR family oxidoreductase [Anaerolineae bacterium]MCB0250087.1 SDR family oxidoreductase [Anaerolineae bacterium]MCB9143443.1 SDR family oxidoreductase [Anaerolineales bacterium]